ncbi:hypothetical protein BD779DRAFT_1760111 [Infundibulicybe gibba]|nr:hypothetical protein BD779DRAFT_1760111 [Infundibulicybe gibba]
MSQSPAPSSFVDPSSLSFNSPSPESEPGPSRKRPRTESSSEERKEARAHRNRIAAQNSRDRRKAQFSYLERRVSELEEENRQLRAGMGLSASARIQEQQAEERDRQKARDRENEELKDRIKTLERGWDAVVKALAAQGLPTGLPIPGNTQPTTTAAPPSSQNPAPATSKPVSENSPANSFTAQPPVFPISPAPSQSDTDFDLEPSSPSSLFSASLSTPEPLALTVGPIDEQHSLESTRHLARVATIKSPLMSLQRTTPVFEVQDTHSALDDATMEDLFREILAPSPSMPPANLPGDAAPNNGEAAASAPVSAGDLGELFRSQRQEADLSGADADKWTASEEEMQRLLDMLPGAAAAAAALESGQGLLSELDLGWDTTMVGVGVF